MKAIIIFSAILLASCKVTTPNAPATSGTPFLYKVEKTAFRNGQKIAKVKGFRYWQHVNDTVKAGTWIPVVVVK